MTDHNTIARRYIELWNERTPTRRREMLGQDWTSDARYVDPLMSGDGPDGVDALIAGVQQRFSGFQIQADRRAERLWRPRPLFLGTRPRRRRQPDQGHGFRRAEGRPHPQHHRVFGPGAAGGVRRECAESGGRLAMAQSAIWARPRRVMLSLPPQTVRWKFGAGGGNRTLVCSLGSCRSAIELRPRPFPLISRDCVRRQARFERASPF